MPPNAAKMLVNFFLTYNYYRHYYNKTEEKIKARKEYRRDEFYVR